MTVPKKLRVIGPHGVYRFFLPTNEKIFEFSEFVCVKPAQAKRCFEIIPDDGSLNVVVNPEEYGVEELSALRGPTWLWFLNRLGGVSESELHDAPRLASESVVSVRRRQEVLLEMQGQSARVIVVGDEGSYSHCRRLGWSVYLSPPPVQETVAGSVLGKEASFLISADMKSGPYARAFSEKPSLIGLQNASGVDWEGEKPGLPTHWVIIRSGIHSTLEYEALLGIVSGGVTIVPSMSPSWGLEPGLDFIEYSTPDELHWIVSHLRKSPHSVEIMRNRTRSKIYPFLSSNVFSRLLASQVASQV